MSALDLGPSTTLLPRAGTAEAEAHYRRVLGRFASGVVIVSGMGEEGPAGMSCQSFFSLSLTPRLVALGISRNSRSWQAIAPTGRFAASILHVSQQDVCRASARSGTDTFAEVGWRRSELGNPLIEGAVAWLDCTIEAVHDGGDHHLVVGLVQAVTAGDDDEPLVFDRGVFRP